LRFKLRRVVAGPRTAAAGGRRRIGLETVERFLTDRRLQRQPAQTADKGLFRLRLVRRLPAVVLRAETDSNGLSIRCATQAEPRPTSERAVQPTIADR
jgi:hypothetical protein